MILRRKQISKSRDGQALVEFAIIVSLLMLILMGIFDLGWAVYARNTITDAAREGARTGIILAATDAQIRSRVQSAAPGLANLEIDINPRTTRSYGDAITVTVVYTYTPITPIIGGIVPGGGLSLRGTSSMKVEGVVSY